MNEGLDVFLIYIDIKVKGLINVDLVLRFFLKLYFYMKKGEEWVIKGISERLLFVFFGVK